MPSGRVDVVIESGGVAGATVMERDLVSDAAAESVTLTVKVKVPAALSIPEITPEESSDSPVGRVPEERDQV